MRPSFEEGTTVEARLVRVETKLDMLIERIEPRHTDFEAKLRQVELDVSALKQRVALVSGGTGALSGVLTAVLAHFIGA